MLFHLQHLRCVKPTVWRRDCGGFQGQWWGRPVHAFLPQPAKLAGQLDFSLPPFGLRRIRGVGDGKIYTRPQCTSPTTIRKWAAKLWNKKICECACALPHEKHRLCFVGFNSWTWYSWKMADLMWTAEVPLTETMRVPSGERHSMLKRSICVVKVQ